jgi:hypothetical protein
MAPLEDFEVVFCPILLLRLPGVGEDAVGGLTSVTRTGKLIQSNV